MFKFFKKEIDKEITGKVERIGILPSSEYQLRYVFTFEDNEKMYHCFIDMSYTNVYEICLTKVGDELSFSYDEKNCINIKSFKNNSI